VLALDKLSSDIGDSARTDSARTESARASPLLVAYDGTLLSLSAPASDSKCIEARLLSDIIPDMLM
jgi:hypothetical protein